MRFYTTPTHESWYGTLTAAHRGEKTKTAPVFRPDLLIVEVEVQTDKPAILGLLNNEGRPTKETGRRWTLTTRGGLREIKDTV